MLIGDAAVTEGGFSVTRPQHCLSGHVVWVGRGGGGGRKEREKKKYETSLKRKEETMVRMVRKNEEERENDSGERKWRAGLSGNRKGKKYEEK